MNRKIILASQSPRRQELMKLLFDEFEVRVSDADESLPDGIDPASAVESLALRKAKVVAKDTEGIVIGADTVVSIDGLILNKPKDPEDAAAMLRRLSGKTHEVFTGVAICSQEKECVFHCCTSVAFCALSEEEIAWYLQTGEPFDKAGGYGIQGWGARFIKGITGDYFNVMGLPVNSIYEKIGVFTK